MLTKLRIQNFKQFDEVEIELGPITVLVGPNNSGKTTALQALTLWYAAYLEWREQADTLNRYALTSVPVAKVRSLWRDQYTGNGDPISMAIRVEGTFQEQGTHATSAWSVAIQYHFANEESILIQPDVTPPAFEGFPKCVFVPSMSGIDSIEPFIQPGRINVLLGEGRTAEALRNMCHSLVQFQSANGYWDIFTEQVRALFHIELLPPHYLPERGEVRMSYRDHKGTLFDLPSTGRGMLQIMLLLASLYQNPGALLLLDEPDSHLEILRQRDLYTLIAEVATTLGSQIIMATHSGVILEAAFQRKDPIIAFVGKPHSLRKYGDFVKSLSLIPAEDYILAEQTGWILYTEGTTDYDILRAFAERLKHPAAHALELTFHKDIGGNMLEQAREHFKGLCEAKPELVGLGIFDKTNADSLGRTPPALGMTAWRRREIENYLMQPETLVAYAAASSEDAAESYYREALMRELAEDYMPPNAWRNRAEAWWSTVKASDDYLDRIFAAYSERLGVPVQLRKSQYYLLVPFIPFDQIDPEVTEKLDALAAVASRVSSRED